MPTTQAPTPFDPPDAAKPIYDALTTTQRTLIVQLHQLGPVTATTSSDQAALVNRGLAQRLPVSGTTKLIVSSFGVTVAQYAYAQGVTP